MIGHGSPSSSPIARARGAPRTMRTLVSCCTGIIAQVALLLVLGALLSTHVRAQDSPLKVNKNVPAQQLEIVANRESLIFAPGEEFSFELRPRLAEMAAGTSLDILATLSPGRSDDPTWSEPKRLDVPIDGAPAVGITIPLPTVEGVYTIRVSATRSPGFRQRFFPGAAYTADRSFDVVVLDPKPPRAAGNESWEIVLDIDPTNPGWWERLPRWTTQLRRLPAMNFRQLGSTRTQTVDLPYGRFVELPPTADGADPHWQAYSLPVEAVGVPHLLEIDYPTNDQHFSLSVVEPNAANIVEGASRDGGVYVEGFGRADKMQTHRMVFWPRTQSPMLLVANQHPSAAATFGHIRVLKRTSPNLGTASTARSPADRLVAAYIARPLLAESFGATSGEVKSVGPISSEARTFDDWQTFYECATRLAESVRYGGYNSAVVSVLADGSAIYPSAHCPTSPLYNPGRAASDFPERDALELLLRVFDRDNLALVPAIQLAAPLPELEELRRGSDPQSSGLEWVGPNGKTWVEINGTQQGLAPHYNLLDTRVQQAILNVASELADRYGHHAAFAGISIQLSANGYAQLPPLDWGLDDATIAKFERDTGIQIAAAGPNRFSARHALLTGAHAEAWRKWRIDQVTNFYAQLASQLRDKDRGNNSRLILTLEESFAHPNLAARVRPAILGLPNRVETALLDAGIDRSRLQTIPDVVVCPTRYIESMAPLAERAIDLELNDAFAAWPKLEDANAVPGALLYHRPRHRELASFDLKNMWKIIRPFKVVSQPSAHGDAVRAPYVRALLEHDPIVLLDGGESFLHGQDDTLREAREIVRQLPTAAEVTDIVQQPVTVRTFADAQGVTLLVVNASPWQATADVALEIPRDAVMQPLAAAGDSPASKPAKLAAGQQSWRMTLEPFAIRGVRINASGARVLGVTAEPSKQARAELDARLTDFETRNLTAPRSYDVLTNPGFESMTGAAPIAGWKTTGASVVAELDDANPRDGATCVHFRNERGPAVLESDPFPCPPTGQLAMFAFVRGQQLAPGSELRMAIEADSPGYRYRRSVPIVPTAGSKNAKSAATDPWQAKPILINDLPLELRSDARIRFEMTGPGEVWLDAIAMHDLLFPLEWYTFGKAERLRFLHLKHAAKTALEEGRIVDCTREMDKYWPRFLAEYTAPVQLASRVAPNPRKPLPAQPNQAQQTAPSVRDHIKRVLPSFK